MSFPFFDFEIFSVFGALRRLAVWPVVVWLLIFFMGISLCGLKVGPALGSFSFSEP
jgi:hypothetical protein